MIEAVQTVRRRGLDGLVTWATDNPEAAQRAVETAAPIVLPIVSPIMAPLVQRAAAFLEDRMRPRQIVARPSVAPPPPPPIEVAPEPDPEPPPPEVVDTFDEPTDAPP